VNTVDGYHKSSHSANSGECVEVREGVRTRIRDTRNRDLGHLSFDSHEWSALVDAVRVSP
jgi:hypothetical protein